MNITEIATAILPSVMEIIGTIAMLMAAKIGIPWLREQRIFSLVRKLVKGAEKAAEAGKIPKTDKHALVIKLLKMKNIEVTPFLDAFIDAAIKEMDEVAENIADEIANGKIQLIINTPSGKESAHDDSYIRKSAIKHHISYITTMAAAKAVTEGIKAYKFGQHTGVKSLQEYHADIH